MVSKRVKNKPKEKSEKEIVGKQYKNCESQIRSTRGLLSRQR